MKLGGRHLADYGAVTSRKDFIQRPLMSCLILRAYFKTTYRGVLEILELRPRLRQALGLADPLQHYSTLQKFSTHSRVLEIVGVLIQKLGLAAWRQAPDSSVAAMDATGMEMTTASVHFQSRRRSIGSFASKAGQSAE